VRGIQTSAAVRRFALDGGLLLLDARSDRLFVYNDTARQIWDLIGAALTADEVLRGFALVWGVPSSYVRDDVSSVLCEWRRLGLISERSSQYSTPCVVRDEKPYRASSPLAPATRQWISTLRDIAVEFATESSIGASLYAMFAHLETPHATPTVRFEIGQASDGQFALVEDGVERIRSENPPEIVGALWQALLERIHSNIAWLALIHGGAVARGGRGIGFCGPSGCGKSTLISALISKGFDYLADDLLALSSPNGEIVPLPMPISVKHGSFEALALHHPLLGQARRYRTKGLDARLLAPPASAWTLKPVSLSKLLFPRFTSGARATVRRISSFEAIERLVSEKIWLGNPMTEARVAAFVTWISDIPTYEVEYGDLAGGVRLVQELAT
jgi:hypothetical protein